MAKVLEIDGNSVMCELTSGKIVNYHRELFGWDVCAGDEFKLLRDEDNNVYLQPARTAIKRSISLADLDEDGDGNVSDEEFTNAVAKATRNMNQITCPKCGSDDIYVETMQENLGSTTVSKTKTKSQKKKHGFLWFLFGGWFYWCIDLILWFFLFIPRLIIKLFISGWKKDKRVSESTTIESTTNRIKYIKLYTCQDCGYTWKRAMGKIQEI